MGVRHKLMGYQLVKYYRVMGLSVVKYYRLMGCASAVDSWAVVSTIESWGCQ